MTSDHVPGRSARASTTRSAPSIETRNRPSGERTVDGDRAIAAVGGDDELALHRVPARTIAPRVATGRRCVLSATDPCRPSGRCPAGATDPGLRRLRRRRQDHDRGDARARGRPPRQAHAGPDDRSGAPARELARARRRSATRCRRSIRRWCARGAPSDTRRAVRDDARPEAGVRRDRRAPRQGSGGGEAHPREPGLRADLGLAGRARRSTPRWRSSTTSTATGEWDLIVVDTPPTAHALDFLDAPRKLSEAIDSPAIEWFRKLQGEGGSRWSLVGKTGAFVLEAAREVRRQQVHRRPRRVLHRVQRHPRRLPPARRGDVRAAAPAARRVRAGREPRADGGARGARVPRAADHAPGCRSSASSSTRCTRRGRSRPSAPRARGRARGAPRRRRARAVGHDAHDGRAGAARRARRARDARGGRPRGDRAAARRRRRAAALLVEVPLQRDDVHDVDRLVALERYLLA